MEDNSERLNELLQHGYRYAFSLTHSSDLAKDLVQEACLKVMQQSKPLEIGYFIRVIRNTFIDDFRRGKKVMYSSIENSYNEADDMPFPTTEPNLERALDGLPVHEREILFLAVVEGYTAKEIGNLTNRPRNTILSIISRTKQKLKKLLQEERC